MGRHQIAGLVGRVRADDRRADGDGVDRPAERRLHLLLEDACLQSGMDSPNFGLDARLPDHLDRERAQLGFAGVLPPWIRLVLFDVETELLADETDGAAHALEVRIDARPRAALHDVATGVARFDFDRRHVGAGLDVAVCLELDDAVWQGDEQGEQGEGVVAADEGGLGRGCLGELDAGVWMVDAGSERLDVKIDIVWHGQADDGVSGERIALVPAADRDEPHVRVRAEDLDGQLGGQNDRVAVATVDIQSAVPSRQARDGHRRHIPRRRQSRGWTARRRLHDDRFSQQGVATAGTTHEDVRPVFRVEVDQLRAPDAQRVDVQAKGPHQTDLLGHRAEDLERGDADLTRARPLDHGQRRAHPDAVVSTEGRTIRGQPPSAVVSQRQGIRVKVVGRVSAALGDHIEVALEDDAFAFARTRVVETDVADRVFDVGDALKFQVVTELPQVL